MVEEKERKNKSRCKRISKDGSVYYYYKKRRKPGPKKKRGPKKKKKISWVRRVFEPWLFKIVICSNKKQIDTIGRFHNEIEIMEKKEELLRNNSEVIFPIERLNNGRKNNDISDLTLEYLILKKNDGDIEDGISKLPNKYGKLVNHKTTNNKWLIWDKFPCLLEETFWVYGYNNSTDRKTISWIYDNLIYPIICDKYNILRFIVYGNKLILEHDNQYIDIVICKNINDCIRLYNTLHNVFCSKHKNSIFIGMVNNSEMKKKYINLIKNKTNWCLKDIYRKSTRH